MFNPNFAGRFFHPLAERLKLELEVGDKFGGRGIKTGGAIGAEPLLNVSGGGPASTRLAPGARKSK